MPYYAHTANDPDNFARQLPESSGKWQTMKEHSENVARHGAACARPFDASEEIYVSGILHDMGKCAARFFARLRDPARVHGINHWAAGAFAACKLGHPLLSFIIDGHHTGLPSWQTSAFADAPLPLQQTLQKFNTPATRAQFTGGCPESCEELLARMQADGIRIPTLSPEAAARTAFRKEQRTFAEAFRTRMLFSCLVDADYIDTESHFSDGSISRTTPALQESAALEILLAALNSKPSDGIVNALRRRLLDDCLGRATNTPGLFTLTAPTGSGKTLSSLAFALRHAAHNNAALPPDDPHRLRRVIVVIPYTSIIEQTADVYRLLFEEDFGPGYVLEHHSAVAPRPAENHADRDAEDERLRRARLAQENWDAPIIVTTSVQFFESLFANRPGDCRKLHNIARSIILFDEVQTLPPALAPSLLSAINLLTREPYGCTAVFMTATQPAFSAARDAILGGWAPTPIESNADALSETLRRTQIHLPSRDQKTTWPELAAQITGGPAQSLCVVNTTKDARTLLRLLQTTHRDSAFHLSSRLCPAHRRQKLAEIRRRLDPKNNEPCLLVSTQLIEAGVDVDFPVAYRALGPLDSIIQTAGRCNREGRRSERCPVYVFRPSDGGTPPGAYKTATGVTESYLDRHPDAEQRLHLPQFYADYFAELYPLLGRTVAAHDPVFAASEQFDFPAAADKCHLVDSNTRSVLVRWQRGDALIEKLLREKHLTRDEWRETQHYSINLYESEYLDAKRHGYIAPALEKEGLEKWYWVSKYDDVLGACHAEGDDFCV